MRLANPPPDLSGPRGLVCRPGMQDDKGALVRLRRTALDPRLVGQFAYFTHNRIGVQFLADEEGSARTSEPQGRTEIASGTGECARSTATVFRLACDELWQKRLQ